MQIYTIQSPKNDSLVELHTYPVGIVDHALGLVGAEQTGLLNFQDVTNPAATSVPVGTTLDWTSFKLAQAPATADKPANTVTYARDSQGGKWVAFPAGSNAWSVKWKDGEWSSGDWRGL